MSSSAQIAALVEDSVAKVAWDWGNLSPSHHTTIAAETLRAFADQAIPEPGFHSTSEWGEGYQAHRQEIRSRLLEVSDYLLTHP